MKDVFEITRRFKFDAGHRVFGHEGKCQHVHGHEYKVHVTCRQVVQPEEPDPSGLDKLGRVIDFSQVKAIVGTFIDEHWDHGMLLKFDDPLVAVWRQHMPEMKRYSMLSNPTAENIAKELWQQVADSLHKVGIVVTKIVVEETENCRAAYQPPADAFG